jgi:hypothetical protein
VFSSATPEISVSVAGRNSAVSLSWTAVVNATVYRVYRSTKSNKQTDYFEATGASFVDTGTRTTINGAIPSVSRWLVKNLFELKNAQDVRVEGNVMENNWTNGQTGYAVLFTPRNQDGACPWCVVQRVTFVNNIVRHAPGGINVLGVDDAHPSLLTNNITIQNNLFDDLGRNGYWGDNLPWLLFGAGGDRFTIDHNTVIHTGDALVVFYGSQMLTNFAYKNNTGRHNLYGFIGDNHGIGNDSISAFIATPFVITTNVLVAGPPNSYPTTNQTCGTTSCFPSESSWESYFVSFAGGNGGNYRLQSGTPFKSAGTDGFDLGADIDNIVRAGAQ